MALTLYNTLTKRKEVFEPLEPPKVRMYNCGPTVYSYAHIGNFASFILADLLRRYLDYLGYEVTQVMNITDVGHLTQDDIADARGEDKLEKKAREEKKDPWEIARFYESAFHEDRNTLNLRPAHCYPRATDHIKEMIDIIQELLDHGLAYEAGDQVYFEIARFPQYGLLSGNTLEELVAGHRVEEDPRKRNPLDFTLWKKDPKHIMLWPSPWGEGFPGWHIECSAMSRKYLGIVFDIHTGGEDNIFPHHECEIAQSSGGEGRIFARYWLHRRHILVEGKKMSKSAGNFFTVRDLLARGYSGPEIRYALLSTHYRSNSNFTFEGLDAAREAIRYLREFPINMAGLPHAGGVSEANAARGEAEEDADPEDVRAVKRLAESAEKGLRDALDDDLNISAALAEVRGFVNEVYRLSSAGDGGKVRKLSRRAGLQAVETLRRWDGVLGVLEGQVAAAPASNSGGLEEREIECLITEREAARRLRDYKEADRLRGLLTEKGIVVKDSPEGPRWHRKV